MVVWVLTINIQNWKHTGTEIGHFVDMMRCQNTKHNIQKAVATQYTVDLVVYSHDRMADWKLWLAAATQHHKKVSDHILLVQEKTKIQSSK